MMIRASQIQTQTMTYQAVMDKLGKTPDERLTNFMNREKFSIPKEDIDWLKERFASGNLPLSFDHNGDVYTVNIASKGKTDLTDSDYESLRSKYGTDKLTSSGMMNFYGELSFLGAVSGGIALSEMHALMSGASNGNLDYDSLISGIVDRKARDEAFMRNMGIDPFGDIVALEDARYDVGQRDRLIGILNKWRGK